MAPTNGSRILLIASLSRSLISFRGDYIQHLAANGYEVFAAAPEISAEVGEQLRGLGATPLTFRLQRTGLNPFSDIRTIFDLKALMKKHRIDLVFPYTIKPVIYGSIAARGLNIQVISLITGLGFTFSAGSRWAKILQRVTQVLYRFALKKNSMVIFQNTDDRDLFFSTRILKKKQPTSVVSGSGVNLDHYPFRVRKRTDGNVTFAMVARLIREKGVDLYIGAAKTLRKEYPQATFQLIGATVGSPSAIAPEILEKLHDNGIISFLGSRRDIPQLLHAADVFVLPTYYREGIPRSILEALSIGMPIITTDTPGCRETISNQKNGYLIPPKDQEALTNAMRQFLTNPEQIEHMGTASNTLAQERFDVRLVNAHLLKIVNEYARPHKIDDN